MSRNPYAPPNADVRDPSDPAAARSVPESRLYSPGQLAFAAFLGSPMAAAWFASKNFKTLGQPHEAQRALLLGVAATIVMLAIAAVLPENFPSSVFPLSYTVAVYVLAKSQFGRIVKDHTNAGGPLGSGWHVAGVSMLIVLAVLGVFVGVIVLLDQTGVLPEDF
jgi:hypothetical protein